MNTFTWQAQADQERKPHAQKMKETLPSRQRRGRPLPCGMFPHDKALLHPLLIPPSTITKEPKASAGYPTSGLLSTPAVRLLPSPPSPTSPSPPAPPCFPPRTHDTTHSIRSCFDIRALPFTPSVSSSSSHTAAAAASSAPFPVRGATWPDKDTITGGSDTGVAWTRPAALPADRRFACPRFPPSKPSPTSPKRGTSRSTRSPLWPLLPVPVALSSLSISFVSAVCFARESAGLGAQAPLNSPATAVLVFHGAV